MADLLSTQGVMMAIYYVIVVLAGALALASFAAGTIGLLGVIGAVRLERCPRCSRHLVAADAAAHALAPADQAGCFFCRHVSLVHPLGALHHPLGAPHHAHPKAPVLHN